MNFISLDVETANADMSSICAVGIVKFEDGRPAGGMKFLVDPDDHFDPMNVAIHGISRAMVAGAPKMPSVLPMMARYLAEQIVIHHTHFDRVALQQAAKNMVMKPCLAGGSTQPGWLGGLGQL